MANDASDRGAGARAPADRTRRRLLVAAAIAVVAVIAFFTALHAATRLLKARVEQALGAESDVAAITIGWSSIEIAGLRMRAPQGWPVRDALRAGRVRIVPDLRSLLSDSIAVRRVEIEEAYVAALRTRDGRLRVLPALTERPRDASPPRVTLGTIEIRDSAIELWDAAVSARAHGFRLERLHGTVDHLQLPQWTGRTRVDLDAVIKGVHRDGALTLRGWTALGSRDTDMAARIRGADLVPFSPYLLTASDVAVRRGALDLDLDAAIRKNVLHAPGKLTLAGVELASGSGSFMGIPRDALLAALKDRNGRIVVQFTVSGDVSDPRFSLRENLAQRIASALAESLGIDVEGLARSVGDAARGVGETVKKLLEPLTGR